MKTLLICGFALMLGCSGCKKVPKQTPPKADAFKGSGIIAENKTVFSGNTVYNQVPNPTAPAWVVGLERKGIYAGIVCRTPGDRLLTTTGKDGSVDLSCEPSRGGLSVWNTDGHRAEAALRKGGRHDGR